MKAFKRNTVLIIKDEWIDVAQGSADGLTRKEIAIKMEKSLRTVENYFQDAMFHMGLKNSSQFIAEMFRNKFIK